MTDFAQARVGQRIAGKFRLVRVLGVGGMGAVYEAINEATEKRLALKLIFPEATRDAAGRERITREATAPNQIGHPGIVDVYDAGTDADGTVYLCMELLEGETLREWLASAGAKLGPALDKVLAALDPLAAAHAKGFVHRDLKPENVFVVGERVKLVDFGLVRRVEASSASVTGSAVGTVHYMSPEQARGSSNATAAADVWSVGVMLYEIVAGRRPFDGESALDVMMSASKEPPPPLEPSPLATLIASCLEKDPKLRPQSAGELRDRLREAIAGVERDRAIDHAHFMSGTTVAMEAAVAQHTPVPAAQPLAKTQALEPDPDFEPALKSGPGAKIAIAIALLVMLVGVGAAAMLSMGPTSYDATSIVIGIEGESLLAPRVLEGFEAELARTGFQTTIVPARERTRAALAAKANDLGARYLVHLAITEERARDGLTNETGYFRQGVTLTLVDAEDGREVHTRTLAFGRDTITPNEGADDLVSAWIHSLGPELLEVIFADGPFREARTETDVDVASRYMEIDGHRTDVELVRDMRAALARQCEELGSTVAAANASATPPVSCYGDPCGQTLLLGLTPDGAHAIVQVSTAQPSFNFQGALRLEQIEERIERVSLADGRATVLATAGNFYGQGNIAGGADAHVVAVIEQGRGSFGVVGIDTATGARRVVTVLEPHRTPDAVLPSPDGAAMFVVGRGFGAIVDASDQTIRLAGYRLEDPTWAALPALGVPYVLALYDRGNDQIALHQTDGNTAIAPTPLTGRFRGYAGALDGLLTLIVSDASGCFLARFDPTTSQMVSTEHIDECVGQARVAHDGRVVAIAETRAAGDTPGDPEIVLVDGASGDVTPLTRGTFVEVNPQTAASAPRVAFERRLESPEPLRGNGDRSIVCWLDLPGAG
jgi:hypothetical protein